MLNQADQLPEDPCLRHSARSVESRTENCLVLTFRNLHKWYNTLGDGEQRLGEENLGRYQSIGESDRMTLKFVKPK